MASYDYESPSYMSSQTDMQDLSLVATRRSLPVLHNLLSPHRQASCLLGSTGITPRHKRLTVLGFHLEYRGDRKAPVSADQRNRASSVLVLPFEQVVSDKHP